MARFMRSVNQIQDLENKRIQGFPLSLGDASRISIVRIISQMPGELGIWLIIEVLRLRKVSRREKRHIHTLMPIISEIARKSLLQGLAHNYLLFSSANKSTEFEVRNWESIRDFKNAIKHEYFAQYDVTISPINVVHADVSRRLNSKNYHVESGIVLEIEDIITKVGSDAFLSQDRSVYFDNNSWPGALSHNFIGDTSILAIDETNCILIDTGTPARQFEMAFWLGYPLMQAWGHWVYEGLFRIELFARHSKFAEIPIVVNEGVSEAFLEFVKAIYPTASFCKLPSGQVCSFKKLYVSPTRTFQPHNIHWSKNDEIHKCNGEWQVASAIRERVLKRIDDEPLGLCQNQLSDKIFISRENANYRKGEVETILEKLAEEFGFQAIDPGKLSPLDELRLFVRARFIFGQNGSGMFLSFLAPKGCQVIMIGSDFSHDSDGWANMVKKLTDKDVIYILGYRKNRNEGFSARLYHQEFFLSSQAISAIQDILKSS